MILAQPDTTESMELQTVLGIDVTGRTQCAHYHTERDIIAIRHKCCGAYYACISCHMALADHLPILWPKTERDTKAVYCGNCHTEMAISAYLDCGNTCPSCQAAFNAGCANHYDLYFEL